MKRNGVDAVYTHKFYGTAVKVLGNVLLMIDVLDFRGGNPMIRSKN